MLNFNLLHRHRETLPRRRPDVPFDSLIVTFADKVK